MRKLIFFSCFNLALHIPQIVLSSPCMGSHPSKLLIPKSDVIAVVDVIDLENYELKKDPQRKQPVIHFKFNDVIGLAPSIDLKTLDSPHVLHPSLGLWRPYHEGRMLLFLRRQDKRTWSEAEDACVSFRVRESGLVSGIRHHMRDLFDDNEAQEFDPEDRIGYLSAPLSLVKEQINQFIINNKIELGQRGPEYDRKTEIRIMDKQPIENMSEESKEILMKHGVKFPDDKR